MTKEITKAFILQQIQDKFALREFAPEKFLFSEMVMPVYDIEPHLEEWWNRYSQVTITATGAPVLFTVPEDSRWVLTSYDVVFMGAGAYTVAGVILTRRLRNPTDAYIYLDLSAAQTVSYHTELQTPLILGPGDELKVSIDGYTSSQGLRLYIDYIVEKIR